MLNCLRLKPSAQPGSTSEGQVSKQGLLGSPISVLCAEHSAACFSRPSQSTGAGCDSAFDVAGFGMRKGAVLLTAIYYG